MAGTRIGIGFDVHRFVRGRKLVLGGVEISFPYGLLGHSDGDALCHAVADAILSAAGLPDIGELFPDNDPAFKNASSILLLEEAVSMVEKAGFRVVSVDAVVICEQPRLHPYKHAIKANVARVLGQNVHFSVKGKTAEKIGVIGNNEALAVQAVALLEEGK